jgi:hypothetical protein
LFVERSPLLRKRTVFLGDCFLATIACRLGLLFAAGCAFSTFVGFCLGHWADNASCYVV